MVIRELLAFTSGLEKKTKAGENPTFGDCNSVRLLIISCWGLVLRGELTIFARHIQRQRNHPYPLHPQ